MAARYRLLCCAIDSLRIDCRDNRWNAALPKGFNVFLSVVSAACLWLAADELFQFYESSGPIALAIKPLFTSSGKYIVVSGHELISIGNFVQFCYFVVAGSVAWCFRNEVFMHAASIRLFALSGLFLVGSASLDFGMIHGRHVWLDPSDLISGCLFKTLEESFKLSGFAMVLGGLMETLLAKRQLISVEKMLFRLHQIEASKASSALESLP